MRKNLIYVFLTLFLSLLMHESNAQTRTITGVVKEKSGATLPGANVYLKNAESVGTITNLNGEFKLTIPQDGILVVAFLGFHDQETPTAGKTVFNVTLNPEEVVLDDIVAVGYMPVHKKNVTSSISSIRTADIENKGVVSVTELISTSATGVQTGGSNAPGGRGNIVIRGNTSISTDLDADMAYSSPLYVVDGVQTSLEDLAGFGVSNVDYLSQLNPADIESIDILKDAAASAVYGSRGANGVIIINTKQGKALDKPEFTFSANFGVSPKPDKIPFLIGAAERDAKFALMEKYWNTDNLQDANVPIMLSDSLNYAFNNNVDYQGIFYQTGVSQQYNLSMRGGGEESNYRISLGYNDNKGVVTNTGFKRYTLNTSLNSAVGDKFTNALRANFVMMDTETGQGSPDQSESYNMNDVLPADPSDLNSSLFYVSDEKMQSIKGELGEKLNTDRFISSTLTNLMRYDFFEGLALSSQVTAVYSTTKKNFYEPSTTRVEEDGYASYSLYSRLNFSTDTYFNFIKELNNHHITALVGLKTDYNQFEDMAFDAVGYGSDNIKVINDRYQKKEIGGWTNISENAMISYFGQFSYRLKDRYILNGAFSMDGSSRFGAKNRWAKFPALSVGWIFSEEPWIKPYVENFVDRAKIKASWGINGKQFTDNYLRYGSYNVGYGGAYDWDKRYNQMVVSSYGGTTGVTPNYDAIGNETIGWERSEQWDIGLELDMFERKFTFTFDMYNRTSEDLVFDVFFPSYAGYNSSKTNIVTVVNYGWESMINYHVFPRSNDLRLDFTLGLSRNENFTSKLPNGNQDYIGDDYGYVVGQPINAYRGLINDYVLDNIDQLEVNPYTGERLSGKDTWATVRPGLPMWKDLNGDYILDGADNLLIQDYSYHPDITGSFNLNFQYKSWKLSAYSQFSFGADVKSTINQKYMDKYDRWSAKWYAAGMKDLSDLTFWENVGDGASNPDYPAMSPASSSAPAWYSFRANQTMWLEDGDYWKITNLSLGYTFDKNSIIKDWNLSRLYVYANVQDVWMWQRSDVLIDASQVNAKGHEIGNGYPQTPTISFGIDLRF